MRTRHQSRLVAQQRTQILGGEFPLIAGGGGPPLDGQVSDFGKADPG